MNRALYFCFIFASSITARSHHDFRIVIDPGHGAHDTGAQCFGLCEKHIALDIGRRVTHFLKKSGYTKTLLTRTKDVGLSLTQRSELAAQIKADLFVSIHVNSGGTKATAQGIETFYLRGKAFLPPTRQGGFMFLNVKNKKEATELVDQALQKNIGDSENLAKSIQNNLVGLLHQNNHQITNRGVKTDEHRVLLRSAVPAALVEVGFLTNPQEARLLSKKNYRQLLAIGIGKGIQEYLRNMDPTITSTQS
jgi:N-acetylmuramoyl-L-alanine amidase